MREASPPGWFLVASDLTKTESAESASCILILSASSAPPLLGEDGSTARTATLSPLSAHFEIRLPINEDLPTPGGPVTPSVHGSAAAKSKLAPFSMAVNALDRSLRLPDRAELMVSESLNAIAIPSSPRLPQARRTRFFRMPPRGTRESRRCEHPVRK